MKSPRAKTSESNIQIGIMRFLDAFLPATYRAFAVPNGGNRNAVTGAILKREGVKAGTPDICLVQQGGTVGFLEVKTEGGRLSPEQIQFRDWCASNGVPFAVVRSIDDVEQTLREWNVPLKARVAA